MSHKHRYVPVLRWKLGEKTGLSNLSKGAKTNVAPFIIVTKGLYGATKAPPAKPKPTPKKAPPSAADKLAAQINTAWGVSPFFLDASDLPGATGTHHHLDDIAASSRALGLSLIPGVKLSSSSFYKAAVKRAETTDGHGYALHVTLAEAASASTWAPSLKTSLKKIDLVVDLCEEVIPPLDAAILTTFQKLHQGASWRTVTMVGGCIPQMLTGYKIGATEMNRHELALWTTLNKSGLPYHLDFGDYGSITPGGSASVAAPTPINAKYSLRDKFVIFHGVKIKGKGAKKLDAQLRGYAKQIVAHSSRGALATCWADKEIDGYAKTAAGVSCGNTTTWIGLNVNRHIEVTRHHLP